MGDKSHVSLEQKVCVVCAKTFDTGALLLDRRLRQSMEHRTTTGYDLCPDDRSRYDAGYVALVETRPPERGDTMQPGEAYRLGRIAHLREEAFRRVINIPSRDANGKLLTLVFIEPQAMDKLEQMAKGGEK